MHRGFFWRRRRTGRCALLCLPLTVAVIGSLVGALPETACGAGVSPAHAAETTAPQQREPAEPAKPFPLVESLYILVLAGFVGFEVIGRVSPLLHTPLMSATNAISGISLVGSLVVAGSSEFPGTVSRILGFVAVTAAMINVVGGFMITDRMLRMFKKKGASR
jgi:NAD/NADP transhydrogenase alpha subunit